MSKNSAAIKRRCVQWIRNAVHDKQGFPVDDDNTLSGMQYLDILDGRLKTPHVSYLQGFQPLLCAPNRNGIAQAVDHALRSLRINRNSFGLLLSDAAKYVVAASAIQKSCILSCLM